jgi:hypothetical protein
MRAREMHNKLDRLSGSVDDDEQTCPDISLLSPEDQDRAHELFEKIEGVENEQEFLAKINENTITEAELRELSDLFAKLPQLGPGDGFKGPSYEIPLELCSYFTHFRRRENEGVHPQFDFPKLKAVQKARFVELCRKYGWEGEYPNADRGHVWRHWAHRDPVRLLPLSQWDPEDEAELRSLLDVAEV